MEITANAHVAVIRTTARKLGTALPAPFDQALADAQALREATRLIEGSAGAVNARIVNCIKQGKDWRIDKEVQALMFERVAAANGIRAAGDQEATDIVAQAVTDHGDTILASWADAITVDAKTLTEAAQRLDVPSLDPGEVDMALLKRRNLINDWAQASSAADRITTARDGWRAIATAVHVPWQRQHEPLIFSDAPQQVIDAARSGNRNEATVWSLARAGAPLRLATIDEYMQRVSRYTAEHQRIQRERDNARPETVLA